MKKIIKIALIAAALLSIVIVDTMANPSAVASYNLNNPQHIGVYTNVANTLSEANDVSISNSRVGNSASLLSMLMIGLTLVGLASFRENKQNQRPDRSK